MATQQFPPAPPWQAEKDERGKKFSEEFFFAHNVSQLVRGVWEEDIYVKLLDFQKSENGSKFCPVTVPENGQHPPLQNAAYLKAYMPPSLKWLQVTLLA